MLWLALQFLWVGHRVSDQDFIAAAEKLGQGAMAREQVEIYHTRYAKKRH